MLDGDIVGAEEFSASRTMRALRQERYRKSGHAKSASGIKPTLLDLPVCAIDGEGKSRRDGSHDYTLLCASWPTGRRKIEGERLSFEACMNFILSLPPNHTYVIFGGNYDFNMMLGRLPFVITDRLLDKGEVSVSPLKPGTGGYRIKWIERKLFYVRRNGVSKTVYDVLANFQKAFVPVCEAWGVGTEEQLEIVRRMKEQRGNFDDVANDAIEDYCYLECDLLRELCRKFFDAILATKYRPRAVYGPGALASAAMEKEGVKRYMSELPEDVERLTRYAYFGGRFDCSVFGWFTDVWQYDIKSAYPDQIRYLPCLKHGEWSKFSYEDYNREGLPDWGMLQVEWNVGDECKWPPFPHRDTKGNVFYPYKGKGWYHAEEVKAALELYGDKITFVTGYKLTTTCKHRPFEFVDELFDIRKGMPYEQGIVFKLILNSLYGKTAQQVGTRNGKKPTFQCFYWAGAITAGTRAKLLRAIACSPDDVLGVATDGLACARELDLDIGSELGQWEAKHYASFAQVSNGIYCAIGDDGKEIERSRGFGRSTLDWEAVRADFIRSRGVGYHRFVSKSRFITIREARSRVDRLTAQCTWTRQERHISFWPARRFPTEYDKSGPTMQLGPLEPPESLESQPFHMKGRKGEVEQLREQWNAYDWQDYA